MSNQNYNQQPQGQPMQQNQQQQDKIFVDGMRIERKFFQNGGSIDKVGICVNDFIQFLQQHVGPTGWVNYDVKISQNTGQPYAELNQWQPQAQSQGQNTSPQQYQQPQQQQAPQYQQPPNEPHYTQQPGPAVSQAPQGYQNNGQPF